MRAQLLSQIADQKKWMAEHGRDLYGYIERYGDPSHTAEWSGEGGCAIYRADFAALVELERQLASLPAERGR